jgi:hypothetical protein
MKAVIFLLPLIAVLLAGCDDSPRRPATATPSANGGSAGSGPADYLNSAAKSQKQAVKTADLTAINKAIESFYVQEGRFPKALDELEEKDFIRVIPLPPPGVKFNYDTNTGIVSLEKE